MQDPQPYPPLRLLELSTRPVEPQAPALVQHDHRPPVASKMPVQLPILARDRALPLPAALGSLITVSASILLCCFDICSQEDSIAKAADPRSLPRDGLVKNEIGNADAHREYDGDAGPRTSVPAGSKRDELDGRPSESIEPEPPKGRNSKTSTPLMSTFAEPTQSRTRPTRSTDTGPAKRNKKPFVQAPIPSDEESIHEGDDEDEEGEPRYCYCNEISFGEMVACDNDACPREWFHLSCVGMTKPPGKNGKLDFLFSGPMNELISLTIAQ